MRACGEVQAAWLSCEGEVWTVGDGVEAIGKHVDLFAPASVF